MKLTKAQRRALELLAKFAPNYSRPMTATFFARLFWKDSPSWNRTSKQGVRGQFMPAKAAVILYRLVSMNLAHCGHSEHSQPRWYISSLGLAELGT